MRCGTPALLPAARLAKRAPRVLAASAGPKQVREAFAPATNVRESDNFALKWTNASLTDEQADFILTALEDSWTMFIDVLGHGVPLGGEMYKVNAFVSDAEDNPPIDFGGGYAGFDDDGYPFLVMSDDLLEDRAALRHVASHEFYHDVQLSADAFFEEASFWFWEATAEWASQELDPAELYGYLFIGAYALSPELPLYHYGDALGGADPIVGVHQYGASLYPRFVSARVGDPTLIPRVWIQGGSDPLATLATLTGRPLADEFAEFAAHNATWDYAAPQKMLIEQARAFYLQQFPERDPTIYVDAVGTGGMTSPPSPLGNLAYATIAIERPSDGAIAVAIEPDASGTRGTATDLRATLVIDAAGDVTYQPVPFSGGTGTLSASIPEAARAYVVVASVSAGRAVDERFGFRYSVETSDGETDPDPDPDPDPGPDPAAGCSATGTTNGPAGAALVLVLLLIIRGRS